jgi:hypothetical protein
VCSPLDVNIQPWGAKFTPRDELVFKKLVKAPPGRPDEFVKKKSPKMKANPFL